MNSLQLIFREIRFRRTSFALAWLVVSLAVALAFFQAQMERASENETRVLQRDLGLNVMILSDATNLDRYWTLGYSEHGIPEEYLTRLSEQDVANRLIPFVKRRLTWNETEIFLTGIGHETFKRQEKKKAVFGMEISPGHLVVGPVVAERLQLQKGQTTELLGETFVIDHILANTGTGEDVRVYANLNDAQRLLDMNGRINEIQALECHCEAEVDDPLAVLRAQLEPLLPGTMVLRKSNLADARRKQRQLAERRLGTAVPLVVLFAGLLVGFAAALNVRERRGEIGIYVALGFSNAQLASLFLGRAVILGTLGALAGVCGGWIACQLLGPQVFRISSSMLQFDWNWLGWSVLLTPLLAACFSAIPTTLAATSDPATVLQEA